MAKKKPITIGEMRRKQRSRAAKSNLEMGPAKMDTSHIWPMKPVEEAKLKDVVTRADERKIRKENIPPHEFEAGYNIQGRYLEPGSLGQVRSEKIKQMTDRLKSPLFSKRLSDQGIHYDPEVLDHVSRGVETTPVRLGHLGPFTQGTYQPKKGKREIKIDAINRRASGRSNTARTLRHELEHDLDERFRDAEGGLSLAERQMGVLGQLGAVSEKHDHSEHGHGSHFGEEKLYSPGHVRIGIMALRDEVGKEFVTADDLREVLSKKPQSRSSSQAKSRFKARDSRYYLERMLKTGKSLKAIADLINQVAARQKAAARESTELA